MKRNNLILVLTTMFVLVASCFSPLSVNLAKAADLISCDESGVCTVRLDYYDWPDYENNIVYGFQNLGHGQNEWVIPAGGVSQSFGARIGQMADSGYKTLQKKDMSWMPALGVCDVASIVHYVAEMNGLQSTRSTDNHVQLPVLPYDGHYANSIFQNESTGNYDQDLELKNELSKDAVIRWMINEHVLTIWVEIEGETKVIQTPSVESTLLPNGVVIKTSSEIPTQTSPDLKNILDQTGTTKVIFAVAMILVLIAAVKVWSMNRKVYLLEKQLGKKTVYKKSKILVAYWWLTVVLMIVSFWLKDEVLWMFTGISVQIWVIQKLRDWGKKFILNTGLEKHIPWFLDLTKELVLVLIVGCYVAYVVTFGIMWVPIVWANSGEDIPEIPVWAQNPNPDPVIWSGAPLAKLPEGVVIPIVWEPILKAVNEEGGTAREAALLYAVQRSECARADFNTCTSSAGAQGPFQFMPTTWPDYSETSWNKWDLHDSARAAYRMFKKLRFFEQTTKSDFQNRFTGQDGGLVWNHGTPGSAAYDGWDQSGSVWDQYQSILAQAGGVDLAPLPTVDITSVMAADNILCSDPLAFCGFALNGGPSVYVMGTAAIGGNDFHCNLINECGWDYWKSDHRPSSEDQVDVLSMLNGTVSRIGVYENGTPYLEITNSSGRKQASYHCDRNYVTEGDVVVWGQAICLMGNIGDSDWTHLHLVLINPDGSSVRDQTQFWPK
ncbi:MAG: peptidoglycan DD-metalloendopeptidase family protein [Microgenomates group bacterium]